MSRSGIEMWSLQYVTKNKNNNNNNNNRRMTDVSLERAHMIPYRRVI